MRPRAVPGRRLALPLAAMWVLASLLVAGACTQEQAPSDASPEKFCDAFNLLAEASSGEDFRAFASRLEQVGTPPDISSDGREGFEVVIRVARSLPRDATLEELEDPDVSNAEAAHAEDFLGYGSETCRSIDGESGAL